MDFENNEELLSTNTFTVHPAEFDHKIVKTRILGLFVNPDLPIEDGQLKVPALPYAELNFRKLGEVIGSVFVRYGNVRLLMPNDYVDIQSFDERMYLMNQPEGAPATHNVDMRFSDYGSVIRSQINLQSNGIIDVRHFISDMRKPRETSLLALPPEIIPLVLIYQEEEDYEDWRDGVLRLLNEQGTGAGELPEEIKQELEDQFRVPFDRMASLILMA